MYAHTKVVPDGNGNIGLSFFTTQDTTKPGDSWPFDNTIPAMRLLGNNDAELAGDLTVAGTINGITEVITTAESNSGMTFGGQAIMVRRVTGTTQPGPTGGNLQLFTPSTGVASRLLRAWGWVERPGQNQRHMIESIPIFDAGGGHASLIYQTTGDGRIHLFNNNSHFFAAAFDIAIYYAL